MNDDAPLSESREGFYKNSPTDLPPDEISQPEAVPEVTPSVPCWRCGKPVAVTLSHCPICNATARHEIPLRADNSGDADWSATDVTAARTIKRPPATPASTPIVQVIMYFLAMLVMSVVEGGILRSELAGETNPMKISETLRRMIVGFEIASIVLILWTLLRIPRPLALPAKSLGQRALGWLTSIPLLGAALAINLGYHWLLLKYLRMPQWMLEDEMYRGATLTWLVMAICVQPAIFEELFFRYLAFGHLRAEMRDHTAVWLSSMMFAFAHLGAPLSMPALFVVGVALGYARVWSGSMLLPMLMHAVHNGVVIFLETQG